MHEQRKDRSSVGRAGDTTSSSITCPLPRADARGSSDLTVASSTLAGPSSLTAPQAPGAHGRMPRATGNRSSAATHRARCRRTTSQCPTRAGPCGSTTPRRGCDSRRPGHHLHQHHCSSGSPQPGYPPATYPGHGTQGPTVPLIRSTHLHHWQQLQHPMRGSPQLGYRLSLGAPQGALPAASSHPRIA